MKKNKMEQIITYSLLGAMGIGIVFAGYFVGDAVFKSDKEIVSEVPGESSQPDPGKTPDKIPGENQDVIMEKPEEIPDIPAGPEIVDEEREIIEEKFEEYINYEVIERDDSTLDEGKTRVKQEGKLGLRTFLYEVTVENGRAVKRELIRQEITVEPQDRIILIGTKKKPVISTKTIYEAELTAYATEYIADVNQLVGYEKLLTEGVNGEIIKTVIITYKDGVEDGREVESIEVKKEPVNEVIIVGTKEPPAEDSPEEPIDEPDGESPEETEELPTDEDTVNP